MTCEKCPQLCELCLTKCMGGVGPENADLMVIGEAPGKEEDELGIPFIGRAGRYMKKNIFLPLDIDEAKVRITNAVRCRPLMNRQPKRAEILNCREHLENEIREIKPKVIIVLGNVPLCSIIYGSEISGITKWRGRLMYSYEFKCWVIGTFHPSALMRDRGAGIDYRFDQSLEDFQIALGAVSKSAPMKKMPVPKLYSQDHAGLRSYLDNAMEVKVVAVDLETVFFDPRNKILGMSMCYKSGERYYPIYFDWKMVEEDSRIIKSLKIILQSRDIVKLMHNSAFDYKFLHYHGFHVNGNIRDTMLAAHLLDENFSAGLKQNTWRYLGFGGYEINLEKYKFENKLSSKISFEEIPFSILGKYAAFDSLATYQLDELFLDRLKEEDLFKLYNKITMRIRKIMTKAEITGIYIDVKKINILNKRCLKALKYFEEEIHRLAGGDFKISSKQQLSTVLFENMHVPIHAVTKTGRPKVDIKVLEYISKKYENKKPGKLCELLLKYNYLNKIKGTYIEQVKRYIWNDGRVHSNYMLHGTVTGRSSNTNPCNHNIPKDRLIRSFYTASPGHKFVEADLSQAEMRIMAAMSKEPRLLEIFENEEDVHTQTYNEIFGKSKDYIPKQDERRLAKTINFGLIYGITTKGLAKKAGVKQEKAEEYMKKYFNRFEYVKSWIKDTIKSAHVHGFVVNPFGRKRRLSTINSEDEFERGHAERQAQNFPIQSGASDYMYFCIIRLNMLLLKYKMKSKIVHTVHDNVIVDCPVDEVDKVLEMIKAATEKTVKKIPIEMKSDRGVSNSWGEYNESSLEKILSEVEEM